MLKRNGKEYERLADHVGVIPVVIVSPADASLISDAADERRRYLNGFISQLDRPYLAALMRYNAVLAERNRLLKNRPDETVLEIYDRQMAEHGAVIHARRQEYAGRLRPLVGEFYRLLSGDREQVELIYRSELNDRPFDELLRARGRRTWPTSSPPRASTATTWCCASAATRCANTARKGSRSRSSSP